METGSIIGAVGNFAAFSLVAWLVRHTFSHTIPRLAEDFQKMLTDQRKAAVDTINAERVSFIEETRAQRRDFLEELRRLSQENSKERHDCFERMEALREKVEELADTIRQRQGGHHG